MPRRRDLIHRSVLLGDWGWKPLLSTRVLDTVGNHADTVLLGSYTRVSESIQDLEVARKWATDEGAGGKEELGIVTCMRHKVPVCH